MTSENEPSPRSLIVSFFGAYGRQAGGWVAVADLIRLLADLGVDPQSVRSSVSRLKRRGLLEARQAGGSAGYSLSEQGRQILADGDRRIYRREVSTGWVMAVFSVPESERHKRHLLRSRLAWLGFGTVAPGVWIAPAHLEEEVRHTLDRLDLGEYVELFRAEHPHPNVARWWDLPSLEKGYAEFVAAYEPVLRRCGNTIDDKEAFAAYLPALDAWRRMPYLDPGLPPELIPDGWSGTHAAEVFFGLHDRLRDPGLRHVTRVANGGAG